MGVSDEVRTQFEAWVSAPPFEYSVARWPVSGASAWPGSYRDLHVQLAWEAWQAALPRMQPIAEDTIARVGDPVGFVCGHCGAAHKEEPFLAHIDRKQQEARTTQPAPVDGGYRVDTAHLRKMMQAGATQKTHPLFPCELTALLDAYDAQQAQPIADAGEWPAGVLARDRTLEILRRHNEWRRGADTEQTDPRLLGLALDAAIAAIAAQREAGEG